MEEVTKEYFETHPYTCLYNYALQFTQPPKKLDLAHETAEISEFEIKNILEILDANAANVQAFSFNEIIEMALNVFAPVVDKNCLECLIAGYAADKPITQAISRSETK